MSILRSIVQSMTGTRPVTVGITGHRPNRLPLGPESVSRRIADVLSAIKRINANATSFLAQSAVAEGADRLFAEAALAQGFALHALLPFRNDDYQRTFGDTSATSSYRRLLKKAGTVTELPGSLDDEKAAYESVGHRIADTSDVLIAVWDGKPSQGRGGTPEIIEHAVEHGTPVVWIDAASVRAPVLLSRAKPDRPRSISLGHLWVREEPLNERSLARLAPASR
jgi:hypothetical protein